MAGAGLGLGLVVLLARLLGVADSGVVLQVVGVLTIVLAVVRLGLDTAAMWLLPRLLVRAPGTVPAALTALLVPAVLAPCVVVAGWFGVLTLRAGPVFDAAVDEAISAAAPFLPFASLTMVATTATRALGGLLAYQLVQNVAIPGGRLVVVAAVVGAGGTAVAGSVGWAVVFVPAAVVGVVVLLRAAGRVTPGGRLLARPDRALVRTVARFGLPRTVSAAAEQASLWLPLVLVGVLLDAGAAGAYGAAARLVAAGVIVTTAARVAVAPRFSALLAQGDTGAVAGLYAATARGVLLLGAPVYVVLAVFAPTVLRWLGPDFDDAAVPLAILCLGSTVMLSAGTVQSLLLMSGGSGWAAVNRAVALAAMVAGVLVLTPPFGMTGAALAWSLAAGLDVVLAAVQVRRRTGIALDVLPTLAVATGVLVAVGAPCLLAVLLLGQGATALAAGGSSGSGCLALACWARFHPSVGRSAPWTASR